jgi:hypothetical protein
MQGYVKVQATAGPACTGLGSSSASHSSASTSSLSSDTDDPTCSLSDTASASEDESLETNIAYLNEKQGLLQRFSEELLQDELYQASAARQDIATHQEEEQDSLSSTSYTLSDDEDDEDFLNSGISIWVRAKKVLRSLSRHRGVLYHPASHSGLTLKPNADKKRTAAPNNTTSSGSEPHHKNKKQRRVRFEPEVKEGYDHDESSESSFSSSEDDLERASRCARRIIENSPRGVRRLSAAEFALQMQQTDLLLDGSAAATVASTSTGDTATRPDAPSSASTSSSTNLGCSEAEAFMLSLHSILADPKPFPFPPRSIPFHTAG